MMKKIIFIILIIALLVLTVHADEIGDILKNNIGKLANVYILQYNSGLSLRGIIVSVDDKILVLKLGKDDVSNPDGKDKPGTAYIKVSEIIAVKIADIKIADK